MVIAISGMIGSGKSTLTKGLHKHYKNSLMLEEFANNDEVFNTFLKWCYEKQPNIDIAFQSFIVESLSSSNHKALKRFYKKYNHDTGYLFLDRFVLEHYIFAIVTLEKKHPKYLKAFSVLFDKIYDTSLNPDLAIYIKIDWETFKNRIFERGREVEIQNFYQNEEYFRRLHSVYLEQFEQLVKKHNIPFITINSNNKNDKQVLEEAIEYINEYYPTK